MITPPKDLDNNAKYYKLVLFSFTSPEGALVTDALAAGPAVDGQLLGVQLAAVDVTALGFADRTPGHAGRAPALLQGVQLLGHLE